MHQQATLGGGSVIALFSDYGQRGSAKEREASRFACQHLNIDLVELEGGQIGEAFRSRQKQRLHVPVPHRNLLILSLALSLAAQEGAKTIALALQAEDVGWYPSASLSFVDQFRSLASVLEPDISVHTPFIALSKSQVITRGHQLGLDYAQTYSCMKGSPNHCGACKQCKDRRKAFEDAGAPEPAAFYERP